ncbi:MAG: right-handed parallel beta-helix repeat-containing protein, partial [Methanobacteriota archaeon]
MLRSIFNIIFFLLLFLFIISVSGLAESAPRSCMVLVTATSGGSVQPEGAVTVPYGSGITLTFIPSSGYIIQTILVDGSDAGQYSSIALSPVMHDMTVHVIFIPEGRSRATPVYHMVDSSTSSSGSAAASLTDTNNQPGECTGAGCTSEKIITVGPSGADYTKIQDAIINASPGDQIYIEAGTYPEQIIIQKPLSLIGLQEASGRPVISPNVNGSIITISADDVLIKNLSVTNASGDSDDNAAVIGMGISDLTIQNCVISDSVTGINLNGSQDISIKDCIIQNNSQIGILLTTLNKLSIKGNSIERCHIGIRGDQLNGLSVRDNLIGSNTQ